MAKGSEVTVNSIEFMLRNANGEVLVGTRPQQLTPDNAAPAPQDKLDELGSMDNLSKPNAGILRAGVLATYLVTGADTVPSGSNEMGALNE